jgi:inosose dehydratase
MRNIQFAINPLQWLATDDGWLDFTAGPPLPQLLDEIREAGFSAISVAPPLDGAVGEYATTLDGAGIAPAPGYLSGPMHDVSARADIVSRAERLAAAHAELGLTEVFVASNMSLDAPRVLRPARGTDRDETRLATIVESLTLVASATQREGVTSCLHQHVGTWIEIEEEVEWILDRVDPGILALGPDTGHHAWAGTDPPSLISRHSDRVRGLHVKDVRISVAERFRDSDASYREVVVAGVWVEPGRGELDLRGAIEALPADFSGWAIVEVDRPDLPTPQESARASAEWTREAVSW